MKTLLIILGFSVVTSLSIPNPVLQTKQPQTAPATKVRTGTISIDERHFIDEGDLKVWSVTNTNVLKGHAGHRVRLQVVDATKDALTVKVVQVLMPQPPLNNDDILRVPELFPRR
jgi:hypothetical protein